MSVERKEFKETKVIRTASPYRTNFHSSNQNLAQFDQNLDHLLEDLQNSVSPPGSALGTYGKTNSLHRTTNGTANPLREYSSDDAYTYTSPDGREKVTGYKKESYKIKNSGGNQLDSLLDDLQQAKNSGFDETDYRHGSKKSVQRELHYDDIPRSNYTTQNYRKTEHESSLAKDIHYSSDNLLSSSPLPSSRTSTLSKQTKVSNIHNYPLEVVETSNPDIDPEVLAHLDPNLHPPGNTKVTTTIKTYTYEIPGSGDYPTNLKKTVDSDEKYLYEANTSQTTPSKSFTYKKFDKSSENVSSTYHHPPAESSKLYKETTVYDKSYNSASPVYQKPAPPGSHTVIKENITTRNYQPGYSPVTVPTSNQTYIYNESSTTRNFEEVPQSPRANRKETYIYNETVNDRTTAAPQPNVRELREIYDSKTSTSAHRPYNGYPAGGERVTEIYKHEETRTRNNNDVETFIPVKQNKEPVNVRYESRSVRETSNKYKSDQNGTEPLLPRPFPRGDTDMEGPPKKLDDLMRTIGNEPQNSPYNAGFNAHERELEYQKKVDTLKRQQKDNVDDGQQQVEPVQRSKNVSGPPVYYPPGHELFAKKEEGAAWRAEGAYGKASGKYKYEAESSSKEKSRSGKAIVPVCLPLCCGLPCTIL